MFSNRSAADFRACVKEKVIEKFCKLEKVKVSFYRQEI